MTRAWLALSSFVALRSLPLASSGGSRCIDRDDLPVSDISQLFKRSKKELDAIFTRGCIEQGQFPMGVTKGELVWATGVLPPVAQLLYGEAFELVWEGSFLQKTVCDGRDFFFYFSLLNPLVDGAKLGVGQVVAMPAKAGVGRLADPKVRLDDQLSYVYDFGISKTEDCLDQVSPFGRQRYPFDNVFPINLVREEGRIVGVDDTGRTIELQRDFFEVLDGMLVPFQYEAMLAGPGAITR
ncbi:unnamed protein product [Vitrella brassicaformis CCMP3155]|uniref:Uncharacterized protein n=1 Tax=Vitrella brassicaformis (strain CCMP3155) TaxID=1169540 RepID=A0A0G4EX54_VITBC|nr:unnamed protein product [Vitrella brassicaformis CCMP3155]|eukprot:CEM03582.1 unnamed protein product [Vitrella brassicaformis CCMP3155]